ncbi:unannotated protein [freshwater metagenome]|uniref:Unannotated protein n=1 Tax=freshwater metagenome TaxID=449393 RepID=A0A6J7USL9_9ZZZZ
MNDFVNLCRIDSLLGSLREESKHRHDVVPLRHRSQVIQLAERLDQLRQQADLFVSLSGCSGKGVFPRFGSTTRKADLARMSAKRMRTPSQDDMHLALLRVERDQHCRSLPTTLLDWRLAAESTEWKHRSCSVCHLGAMPQSERFPRSCPARSPKFWPRNNLRTATLVQALGARSATSCSSSSFIPAVFRLLITRPGVVSPVSHSCQNLSNLFGSTAGWGSISQC